MTRENNTNHEAYTLKTTNELRYDVDEKINRVNDHIKDIEKSIREVDDKHDERYIKTSNEIQSIKVDTNHIARQNEQMSESIDDNFSKMRQLIEENNKINEEKHEKTSDRIDEIEVITVTMKNKRDASVKLAVAVIPAMLVFAGVIFQVIVPIFLE